LPGTSSCLRTSPTPWSFYCSCNKITNPNYCCMAHHNTSVSDSVYSSSTSTCWRIYKISLATCKLSTLHMADPSLLLACTWGQNSSPLNELVCFLWIFAGILIQRQLVCKAYPKILKGTRHQICRECVPALLMQWHTRKQGGNKQMCVWKSQKERRDITKQSRDNPLNLLSTSHICCIVQRKNRTANQAT
jgi:hypothetical protein